MLLTSSQVSAAITAGISVCTLALFVSGLVLQRQSVKNLNAVLHPGGGRKGPWEKLVQKAEFALEANNPAKVTDLEPEINDSYREEIEQHTTGSTNASVGNRIASEPDWSRRAYIQLVTSADEICDAMVGITSLSVQGSKARRVLVYPDAWDQAGMQDKIPELELIDIAKSDHMLETMTTGQIVYQDGNLLDSLLNQDFDKMLYLQSQGLIINATYLDEIFDTMMTEESIAIQHNKEPAAILVQPRKSNPFKYEDFEGAPQQEFSGLVETLDGVRTTRSVNNAYRQGQLLGDIGYLGFQKRLRPEVSFREELKRSPDVLLDLILEKVQMDQETVCGTLSPNFWTN